MIKQFLIASFLLSSLFSWAQDYSAFGIPDSLKQNANSVKREENITLEIIDQDRARYNVHQVYTILNRDGAENLYFRVYTNKIVSLGEVEVKVYDAIGAPLRRYRKKDLVKQAYMTNLIDDGMYQYISIIPDSYPLTVEYNYEMLYATTYFVPDYDLNTQEESLQHSTLTVKVNPEVGLRFKNQQIDIKPVIGTEGKYQVYTWTVNAIPAMKKETGTARQSTRSRKVMLAVNKFRMYNTYGDMSSWKGHGQWAYDLGIGNEILAPERVEFFKTMVSNLHTDSEKVKAVYDYLQKNFRYVSIQLGIGGYKPFPAKFTDDKKYGDCKGLSFYTHAVLKSLGIKSHLALINAGYNNDPVDESFSSSGFNHMILCVVPKPKDTIWLECTSNTADFGILGSFTENRNALLLTETGGVLIKTPTSQSSSNMQSSMTQIELKADGSGKTHTQFVTKGDYREQFDRVLNDKKDDQKIFITRDLGFKQPDEFLMAKNNAARQNETSLDLSIEKIPQFTAGSKMFLNRRMYSFQIPVLPKVENRNEDYFFESPYQKSDSTVYKLPEGYTIDALPEKMEKDCGYASYLSKSWFDQDKKEVISVTRLILNVNRIPAAGYSSMKQFFDQILSDEKQKIVIRKVL